MDFKEAYKFPLRLWHNKVLCNNGSMAFDFIQAFLKIENSAGISEEAQVEIVSILNGTSDSIISGLGVRYLDGLISVGSDKEGWTNIILIRGWGHLIGIGGLNLDQDKAAEIQDAFGNYIVEKLTKKDIK